jgi:SM-20-related protein
MEAIWQYVLAKQNDFRDTQVKPRLAAGPVRDPRYRRSRVLFDIGPHREFMALRLRSYLPWVIGRLIYSPFKFGHLAIHITASNDGDFYRPHCDNGAEPFRTRQITFVLYFMRSPQSFTGGELVLYDTHEQGGESFATGSSLTIVPKQNQIIFFPSCLLHEVRPLTCPTLEFEDSRFTLNGWFYSANQL